MCNELVSSPNFTTHCNPSLGLLRKMLDRCCSEVDKQENIRNGNTWKVSGSLGLTLKKVKNKEKEEDELGCYGQNSEFRDPPIK